MAVAGLGQHGTFVSVDALAENYLARVPLAHALFRAAELWMLEDAALERPVLDVGCGRGEFADLALNGSIDEGGTGAPRRGCRLVAKPASTGTGPVGTISSVTIGVELN